LKNDLGDRCWSMVNTCDCLEQIYRQGPNNHKYSNYGDSYRSIETMLLFLRHKEDSHNLLELMGSVLEAFCDASTVTVTLFKRVGKSEMTG